MEISVVIPSYNRGQMIAATLDAIFKQNHPPHEVIVVDDGSTDDTAAFVAKTYGDRVHVIHQENGGPESARAHGIDAATGDWIAICDSDDVWHADHLARLVALHERLPDANCLFTNFTEVGSAARYVDKFRSMDPDFWRGLTAGKEGLMLMGADQFQRFLPGNPVFPSTMMFTRALYDAIGGINPVYARLPAGDADLTRRMALGGVMACDWHISVDITKHGGNFSADTLKIGLGKITMLRGYLAQPDMFGDYADDIRQAIDDTAADLMCGAFSRRELDGFQRAARELPFMKRPLGLQLRSLFAAMPAWMIAPIFKAYDHDDDTESGAR